MKHNNQVVIVKILNKSEVLRLKQSDHVYSELCILSEVSHPFIIEMYGFAQDQLNLYFIQEYLSGGDLYNLLMIQGEIPSEQAKFYAIQISLVFQYLHMLRIIYRDLKPENLVLAVNGYLKLIDFGFAKKIEGKTYTMCGTPNYMAPEIINNKGHSFPVDWWTLGILVYEFMVGTDPFNDEDTYIVYQKIIKGKMKFPRNFDKDAKSFIKHLLVADVNKRYGCLNNCKEIFEHRWFKSIDIYKLLSLELSSPFKPQINK